MPGLGSLLPQSAVYYPYIHIRDGRWLKIAALYWPHLVRVVGPGYPITNSGLVDVLAGELGFLVDHSPEQEARAIAGEFAQMISGLDAGELARLRVPDGVAARGPGALVQPRPPVCMDGDEFCSQDCVPALEWYAPGWRSPDIAGVHSSEIAPALTDCLISAGLAVPVYDGWLAMIPELAWFYKCRLTEEVARGNNLVPATDQPEAHAVIADHSALAAAAGQPLAAGHGDVMSTFGLLAIEAVVPRDLEQIPARKIVEIRRRFAGQFDRWRAYADDIGMKLSEQLKDVQSPDMLRLYLDDAVRQFGTTPAGELRQGLASDGIDAAAIAVNSKFQLPAALAAAGITQPYIAAAGGAAFGLVNLRRTTRQKASQARQAAPAAHLLSVQETLAPQAWLTRVITAMQRLAGTTP
jgi:hypothetical protein